MSSMSPEGNAAAGNTPTPRRGGGGRGASTSGAASRVAVDTRDLTKLKSLLADSADQAQKLAKALKGIDIGSLKAVNNELTQMRSLLGMSGKGGGVGGVGASNSKASSVNIGATQTRKAMGYNDVMFGGVTGGPQGPGTYSPQVSFGTGPTTGQPSPQQQPQAVGTPGTTKSYSQRFSSYMSEPVSSRGPGRDYAGMSRAKAGALIAGTAILGGAIKFGGRYAADQLTPLSERDLLANRLSIGQGGSASYTQRMSVSSQLTSIYAAGSSGFSDTTAAGQAVRQLGGGGSGSLAFARSGASIAALDPSIGAASAQQMAGQITGVRAQNMLRGLGVKVAGIGNTQNNSQTAIDGYINMYERVNRHKLTYDEIESAYQQGYPLNRSITAIFGAEQIPAIVNRWHQKNSKIDASNITHNLANTLQQTNQKQNQLQTTASPGVISGLDTFLRGKGAALDAANSVLKASGSKGQDAIATAVGVGLTVNALSGIKGTLDKMLAVMTGRSLSKALPKLLPKALPALGAFAKRAGPIGALVGTGIELEPDVEGAWNSAMKGDLGRIGDPFTGKGSSGTVRLLNHLNNALNPLSVSNAIGAYDKAKKVGSYLTGMFGGSAMTGAGNTGVSSAKPAARGGGGNVINKVVSTAESFLGDPYRYGGSSPQTSFDCSGLIQYSYGQAGIKLPRTADAQSKVGQQVSAGDVRVGDLLFFKGADGTASDPGHVGMYIGGGKMIQSPHTGANISITGANLDSTVMIRRVANGGGGGSQAMPVGGGVTGGGVTRSGNAGGQGIGGFQVSASFTTSNPDADLVAALSGGGLLRGSSRGYGAGSSSSVTGPSTSTGSNVPSSPTSSSGNVALAQKMAAARGWSGAQWNALYAVWNQESGFKTTAGSPNHAYGIPQALPGSKMASAGGDWMTNPMTQIKWGLDYISGRYHDPAGALAHKRATDSARGSHAYMAQRGGWYEQGAWSIVKDQIAALHKGEMVVPEKTANMVRSMVAGDTTRGQSRGGGGRNVTVNTMHIHGVGGSETDKRKAAMEFWGYVDEAETVDRVASR